MQSPFKSGRISSDSRRKGKGATVNEGVTVGPTTDGVRLGSGVSVGGAGVLVRVAVEEGVTVEVGKGVSVGNGVIVAVGDCVCVAVHVLVGVKVSVASGVSLGKGVTEGVQLTWMSTSGMGTSVGGAKTSGIGMVSEVQPAVMTTTTNDSVIKIIERRL